MNIKMGYTQLQIDVCSWVWFVIEKEFIAQFDITFDQTKPIKNEEVGTPKNLLGFFLMENMPHCLGDFSNLLNILLEIKKMLGSFFFI